MKAILKIKSTINELGFKPKTLITAGQVAVSSFMNYTKRAGIMEEFCVVKKNEKGQIYNYYIPNSKNAWRIRKAYRGARKEAFVTGKYHGVSLYDVNALYPYAMTQMKFPNLFSELFVLEPYKKGYNNDLLFAHIGVMKCKIRAPVKIKVAFLPIRYKGIVVYPRNTTMSGVWTIGEIKKAVGLGYELLDIEWAIMYPEARVNPFEEYIKHLYDLRLKSKGDLGYVIKLIMNNLYGKFAQDRAIYEYKFIKRMEMDKYEAEGWEYIRSNEDGFTIGKYKGKYRPRYVNPLISALITAEARAYLYDFMNLVDAKDLLYVDTDSIMFTNEAKYRKVFKVNQKIGQWKVLFKNEKACIMRENEYYIGNMLKMSGIGKIYQNRKVIEEGGKICVDRMITFRQGIKTGKMDKVGTFEKVTKEFTVGNKQDIIVPDYIEE